MITTVVFCLIITILAYMAIGFLCIRKRQIMAKSSINNYENQLTSRLKMIQNVYLFIKSSGYSEKDMLTNLKKADALYKRAKTPQQLSDACGYLNRVMDRLDVISKQNSELSTNGDYIKLSSQMIILDEKVEFAKSFYYDSINEYNLFITKSPCKTVANIFGFKKIKISG